MWTLPKLYRLILAACLIYVQSSVYASNIIEVDDEHDEHICISNDLEYFEDEKGTLTIQDVSSPDFDNKFTINKRYYPQNTSLKSTYWVRVKIKHNNTSQKLWLLEFYDQTIDYVEAYIPDDKGQFQKTTFGDLTEFENRTYQHKNFEVKIFNTGKDVNVYYFKVRSAHLINIIITLRSINRFIYYALNEYFLFGVFYGMMLVISFYNFIMYLAFRENQYLAYIIYVLNLALYEMCTDGIGYQYLWPECPHWNQIAYGIFIYTTVISALVFTSRFLNLKIRAPFLYTIVWYVVLARTMLFLYSLCINRELFGYTVLEVIPLSFAFFCGVSSLYKGYRPARFFVIAYSFLFAGFLVRFLVSIEIIPFTTVSHYTLNASFIFEMIFLSFAMSDKVRIMKATKERAQKRIIKQHEVSQHLKDKINRELEQKVRERTTELDEKNRMLEEDKIKLKEQADLINQINMHLDKDNYTLKTNINEIMLSRVMKKNVEYDEFKKIFPDELSCMRYLDEVKWKDGYICKKCGNDKCFPGLQKFAKRCSRCGYNESVTSNTIFQGIKFPIEKAFYITYLVIIERNDLTLDDVSELLELRKNTCWAFKSKISKIIDSEKAKKAREALKDWGYVVFKYTEN